MISLAGLAMSLSRISRTLPAASLSRTRLPLIGHVMMSRAALTPSPGAVFAPRGTRCLFIKVDSTPNPDSQKFVPEDRIVLPEKYGSGIHYSNASQASGCKLVRRLLKYKEITGVFLGRDFVSVNKTEDAQWMALKPIILDALMDAFAEAEATGGSIVEDVTPALDTVIRPEDDEVVAMIKELLETRIRPAVQEDGGDIIFEGFEATSGIVKLRMAGSCVGCPSSTATLRQGVEAMLMHYIPEVKGILQIKDELESQSDREMAELERRLASAGAPT